MVRRKVVRQNGGGQDGGGAGNNILQSSGLGSGGKFSAAELLLMRYGQVREGLPAELGRIASSAIAAAPGEGGYPAVTAIDDRKDELCDELGLMWPFPDSYYHVVAFEPRAIIPGLRQHEPYVPFFIRKTNELTRFLPDIVDPKIRDYTRSACAAVWMLETIREGAKGEGVEPQVFLERMVGELGLVEAIQAGDQAKLIRFFGAVNELRGRKITSRGIDEYNQFLSPDPFRVHIANVIRGKLAGRDELRIFDRGAGHCNAFRDLIEGRRWESTVFPHDVEGFGEFRVVDEDGLKKVVVNVDGSPKKLVLFGSSRIKYPHPHYVNYVMGHADEFTLSGMDEVWDVWGALNYSKKLLLAQQAYNMLRDDGSNARINIHPNYMRIEHADGRPFPLTDFFRQFGDSQGYDLYFTERDFLDANERRHSLDASNLQMRKTHPHLVLPLRFHQIRPNAALNMEGVPIYVYRVDGKKWKPK